MQSGWRRCSGGARVFNDSGCMSFSRLGGSTQTHRLDRDGVEDRVETCSGGFDSVGAGRGQVSWEQS